MWTKEQVLALTRTKRFSVAAASVTSLATGLLVGHTITKKKLETKYQEIAEKEIAEAKEFYGRLHKVDDNDRPLSPEEVLEQLHGSKAVEALRSYQGLDSPEDSSEVTVLQSELIVETDTNVVGETGEIVVEKHNIFTESVAIEGDVWNYELELKARDENPDKPYIIHHDEYFEGEKDYEQCSLTYFEGDDVLVDERDDVVPDTEGTVGDDNLTMFGHGSKDENTLYVRNDEKELDFEIVRHEGKYSREILGFEDTDARELKHSYSRTPRKFRGHDE